MKKANLYIRVSTDEQAEKGYSQRNQEEVLRKYCEIKSIIVGKVYYEDHSAKTFNRPVWSRLLVDLRKNKGQTDLILFTKWDRFSRNTGDAYYMIGLLKKWGTEPQAIEQPLDLEVPENKMMLAFYLAAPEVENERRGMNIFQGLRRARKEGRWINHAPLGYANLTAENGKKYIAPAEPMATILKEAFEELAKGNYNMTQVWKEARKKGLTCLRNQFYILLRNPVYCGLIIVPKYKDEEEHWVNGIHAPLISESLFYRVQEVLDGNKKTLELTKIHSDDKLILRGFLKCPKCTRMLTGSASKGRIGYYHYYHCTSRCGVRLRAETTNLWFKKNLEAYFPIEGANKFYVEAFIQAYKENAPDEVDGRKRVLGEIAELNKKIEDARDMLMMGTFDGGDFRSIKLAAEKRISVLESKLPELAKSLISLRSDLTVAISNLQSADNQFNKEDSKKKRDIVGSIFPENLCFDGEKDRTTRVNDIALNIMLINKELESKKKRAKTDLSALPASVVWAGIEPATHGFSVHCSTD